MYGDSVSENVEWTRLTYLLKSALPKSNARMIEPHQSSGIAGVAIACDLWDGLPGYVEVSPATMLVWSESGTWIAAVMYLDSIVKLPEGYSEPVTIPWGEDAARKVLELGALEAKKILTSFADALGVKKASDVPSEYAPVARHLAQSYVDIREAAKGLAGLGAPS